MAAVLVMQAVPGPDTILVAVRGMGQGLAMAFYTVVGMTVLAGLIQLPLLAFGLAAIAHAFPALFDLIRLAGAAYLVWLGLSFILRAHAGMNGAAIANPNPLIFMLAFLPQFVDRAQSSVAGQLLVLGATQKVTGFGVLALVALASGRLGEWLSRDPRVALWQGRIAGAIMIALGIWLLVAR